MRAGRTFSADPASVPAARRFALDNLDYLPDGAKEAVRLMVSELATNALLYARTDFTVVVDATEDEVQVSVTDRGAGTPEVQSPDPEELHGRGLLIVQEFAHDWGVTPAAGRTGKTVWFRLRLHDLERSSA